MGVLPDYETLLYEERDGVAWVTMNRPDKRNEQEYDRKELEVAGSRVVGDRDVPLGKCLFSHAERGGDLDPDETDKDGADCHQQGQ